jgi:hypothetical protein
MPARDSYIGLCSSGLLADPYTTRQQTGNSQSVGTSDAEQKQTYDCEGSNCMEAVNDDKVWFSCSLIGRWSPMFNFHGTVAILSKRNEQAIRSRLGRWCGVFTSRSIEGLAMGVEE